MTKYYESLGFLISCIAQNRISYIPYSLGKLMRLLLTAGNSPSEAVCELQRVLDRIKLPIWDNPEKRS